MSFWQCSELMDSRIKHRIVKKRNIWILFLETFNCTSVVLQQVTHDKSSIAGAFGALSIATSLSHMLYSTTNADVSL